jgi:Protein of unknown function (DUF3592)
MSVLPLAFLAFGLLFVLLGVTSLVRHRRRRSSWSTFPGRVVGSRLDDGQIRSRVAYVHDGREVTFWNRYTSTTMTDPVGREVEVLVNPDDPNDAVVSGGLVGGGTVGIAMLFFGAAAIVFGLVLLR